MNGIHEARGSIPLSSTTGTPDGSPQRGGPFSYAPLCPRGNETLTVGIDPNILPPLNGS